MASAVPAETLPSEQMPRRLPKLPNPAHSLNTSASLSRVGTLGSGQELITYIFPDFAAVSYFQKEFISLNEFHAAEESVAAGFEIYLVDQWIRSRKIGLVMSVFTGNAESRVKVTKFTIVKKPSKQYPARFQEYLNEVMLNHATFKKMGQFSKVADELDSSSLRDADITEFLLVTNMSAVSHSLNLIPIPGGDTRAVESIYMVNSNLKKLNCGGRSLLLMTEKVSDASEDKFRQMYRIHNEHVPIRFAILELVNLIQTCLFYFDLLDARYCDGLLCQKTEDAINNWWNLIGLPHFNVKPNPRTGILPSKTVAAIISLTLGVRMRLQIFGGCDVPKDPFDFENFMISIGQFQKQVKIEKKRKLDLLTLLRLFYYTNQKFSSDSTKQNFSGFGSDNVFDDNELANFYDSQASLPLSMKLSALYPTGLLSNLTASAYRRNKLYYSKELKKLTNVVKNTVQDHIIVREDDDDIYAESAQNKPSTKLRSKLASKLTDNITPADIETIDIEVFVRKCLVGMTLFKLWLGIRTSNAGTKDGLLSSSSHHRQYRHSQHQHHRPHLLHHDKWDEQDADYKFLSLREKFSANQTLMQNTDKAGRLSKMRFPFQSRRSPSKTDVWNSRPLHSRKGSSQSGDYLESSLLDSELQKITDRPPSIKDNASINHGPEAKRKEGLNNFLNRRHSFPFLKSGLEASLNTVETFKNPLDVKIECAYGIRKSASFSTLEPFFYGNKQLYSYERAKVDYVDCVSKLLDLDLDKREAAERSSDQIVKNYKQINFELVKLHTIHSHMINKKNAIESEFVSVLEARMKDLGDNIDRMAFRSRDLLKKINELDENAKMFEFKMQLECTSKLDNIVESLTNSTKFRYVFKDEEEREKLLFQLNGENYVNNEDKTPNQNYWGIRGIIMFLYEMMVIVLQVFNFDRSKMNLERIRAQYRKLDPNRRYISKAYNFVGRDLVTSMPTNDDRRNSLK